MNHSPSLVTFLIYTFILVSCHDSPKEIIDKTQDLKDTISMYLENESIDMLSYLEQYPEHIFFDIKPPTSSSKFKHIFLERKGSLYCASDTFNIVTCSTLSNQLSPRGEQVIFILNEKGIKLGQFDYFYSAELEIRNNKLLLKETECPIIDTINICATGLTDFFKKCSEDNGQYFGDPITYQSE